MQAALSKYLWACPAADALAGHFSIWAKYGLAARFWPAPDYELSQVKPLNCTGVACNKVLDVFGYWYAIDIAAGLNFFGYLVGNILDPVLKCVEGHYANRSFELAG
ncbi:hypothetical protein [Bradyrhizobium retamae]|uniref:Uncharacterized protein n=1 Tax=Bradyrhizobium retamae TaxID=1300035 RepID=A0A0R3MI32_9BRAD|nr:hypothetical protein [Bradyrhizobium retamae]KRR17727.1 hypothetical protein CQ13_35900 [Bradyrhizobium retamae]